jgi:hypothetical protein
VALRHLLELETRLPLGHLLLLSLLLRARLLLRLLLGRRVGLLRDGRRHDRRAGEKRRREQCLRIECHVVAPGLLSIRLQWMEPQRGSRLSCDVGRTT